MTNTPYEIVLFDPEKHSTELLEFYNGGHEDPQLREHISFRWGRGGMPSEDFFKQYIGKISTEIAGVILKNIDNDGDGGRKIIGIGELISIPGKPFCSEPALLIHPKESSKGLGTALLDMLISEAVQKGVKEIIAKIVELDNTPVLKIINKFMNRHPGSFHDNDWCPRTYHIKIG